MGAGLVVVSYGFGILAGDGKGIDAAAGFQEEVVGVIMAGWLLLVVEE